jgi:hypothetical protein
MPPVAKCTVYLCYSCLDTRDWQMIPPPRSMFLHTLLTENTQKNQLFVLKSELAILHAPSIEYVAIKLLAEAVPLIVTRFTVSACPLLTM